MPTSPAGAALGQAVKPRILASADRANTHESRRPRENSFDVFFHWRLDIARLERRVEAAFAAASFEEAFVGDFEKFVNAGAVRKSFVATIIEHVHDEENLFGRTRCELNFM